MSWMNQFEACSLSPREVVLKRVRSLEGDGVGLASPLVQNLKVAIDNVLLLDRCVNEGRNRLWSWDGVRELKRILQIHLYLSSFDSDLAEELARQGSHSQLLRLLRLDLSTLIGRHDGVVDAERYQDALVEIQDLAGEIASQGDRHDFPLPVSPFTQEELRQRLPLMFCFDAKCRGCSGEIAPCCANVVFIRQVTIRQSDQRDVGFVMWPSAAALSQWIVSNPTFSERSNHILELGAGCGLVGIAAACVRKSCQRSGQRTDRPQVVTLTDFNPLVLRNLEANVALNDVSEHCRVVGLDFNDQSQVSELGGWKDMNGNVHPQVDLILAADIICQSEDAYGAAMLIRNALRPDGRAVVVCADSTARFGVDHFLPACEKVGLRVDTSPVRDSVIAPSSTNLYKTSGYVDGMKLNMFQITRC